MPFNPKANFNRLMVQRHWRETDFPS